MADSPTLPSNNSTRPPRKVVESEVLKLARKVARLEARCSRLRRELVQVEAELSHQRRCMRQLVADVTMPPTVEDAAARGEVV